jgi:hypothetical protein
VPRPQLQNASKAWQLGFTAGVLPRQRPLTLSALEAERQRYQLLLLALIDAQAEGRSADSPAAARVRALAGPAAVAHAAAGSEALLRALLACGVSLACCDPGDGSFPLLAACHLGWAPMQRLLDAGADPNQADASGSTALMLLAARPAMLDAARQLLRWRPAAPGDTRRLDVHKRSVDGRDALGAALAARNRRFGEELLAHLAAAQQAQAGAADGTADSLAGEESGSGTSQVPGARAGAVSPAEPPAASTAVGSHAYELLSDLGACCLADINRPGGSGQHVLVEQVGRGW